MKLKDLLNISGLENHKTDADEDAEHSQLGQVEEKASHVFFAFFLSVLFLLYRFFFFHIMKLLLHFYISHEFSGYLSKKQAPERNGDPGIFGNQIFFNRTSARIVPTRIIAKKVLELPIVRMVEFRGSGGVI